MSENNVNPIVIKFEFPQIVNDALTPLATAIGNTLATGWNGLTIGIETWYGKKKIQHDSNLESYRNSVQKNLSLIKEENLQEPKMNILGPSLEASRYYFEEEQYREMFAKLIASSCDKSKNNKIHPFFVEAIKQMTPQDATILSLFKDLPNRPICKYRLLSKENNGQTDMYNMVFYTNTTESPNTNSSSINNLERLGFLDVSFERYFLDDEKYKRYAEDPFYTSIKKEIASKSKNSDFPYNDVVITKGIVKLTALGENFINICI